MKAKSFYVCLFIMLAASMIVGNSSVQREEPVDENVEALADFEWNENGWYCWENSYDDNGDFFSPISVALIVT